MAGAPMHWNTYKTLEMRRKDGEQETDKNTRKWMNLVLSSIEIEGFIEAKGIFSIIGSTIDEYTCTK